MYGVLFFGKVLVVLFAAQTVSSLHNFNGHSIDDAAWGEKLKLLDCFANQGKWVPHRHGLTARRKKVHCGTTYAKGKCGSSKGNAYDYYTGG